jgi:plasmid stability protein
MADVLIRGIPDQAYRRLRQIAATQKRSVNAYLLRLVELAIEEEEARRRQAELLEELRLICQSTVAAPGAADSVTLLREDRGR